MPAAMAVLDWSPVEISLPVPRGRGVLDRVAEPTDLGRVLLGEAYVGSWDGLLVNLLIMHGLESQKRRLIGDLSVKDA